MTGPEERRTGPSSTAPLPPTDGPAEAPRRPTAPVAEPVDEPAVQGYRWCEPD